MPARIPVRTMSKIGLILHFLKTNKEPAKTAMAIQSTSASKLIVDVPRNVNNNIVAAAEIISPTEADLKPFKASTT